MEWSPVCFSSKVQWYTYTRIEWKTLNLNCKKKQIHLSGKYGNCVPSDSEGGAGTDQTNPKIGLWRSYSLYLYSKEGGLFLKHLRTEAAFKWWEWSGVVVQPGAPLG